MDLKEFTNPTSIKADGNEFTSLEWLFILPESSWEKLKWLSLWGNKIENVDFTKLLNNFPNLQSINLENNPLNLSKLEDLDDEQLSQLVELVETKKLKINSWKGTPLLDLLRQIKKLREKIAKLEQQLQAQVEVAPK
ncbi:Leucine rich repeat protein of unknown function [endosymbiont DhMRE of Dentiscutata heterogama]|uniref:hypothetical protein n=1 Tax=endosymbiont DhMRE of Dentiscutata heterogama TaxID=1609546 RepID=UPI000629D57E|nr:hypothetical protein [endosymbiont DhMRE of Dentiscutata heterogama]CFW93252.1 Leucine rich repeat protein of unknown function [endosymbiont DhMRE of Dentiscutata heterogama]